MYFLLKIGIFHCYVSLPEGSLVNPVLFGGLMSLSPTGSNQWESINPLEDHPILVQCLLTMVMGFKSPKDFGLGWIGPLPNGLNG